MPLPNRPDSVNPQLLDRRQVGVRLSGHQHLAVRPNRLLLQVVEAVRSALGPARVRLVVEQVRALSVEVQVQEEGLSVLLLLGRKQQPIVLSAGLQRLLLLRLGLHPPRPQLSVAGILSAVPQNQPSEALDLGLQPPHQLSVQPLQPPHRRQELGLVNRHLAPNPLLLVRQRLPLPLLSEHRQHRRSQRYLEQPARPQHLDRLLNLPPVDSGRLPLVRQQAGQAEDQAGLVNLLLANLPGLPLLERHRRLLLRLAQHQQLLQLSELQPHHRPLQRLAPRPRPVLRHLGRAQHLHLDLVSRHSVDLPLLPLDRHPHLPRILSGRQYRRLRADSVLSVRIVQPPQPLVIH